MSATKAEDFHNARGFAAGDKCDRCNKTIAAACLPCNFGGCEAHTEEHNKTCPVEIESVVFDLYAALNDALAEADDCDPMRLRELDGALVGGVVPRPHFAWREDARAALCKAEAHAAAAKLPLPPLAVEPCGACGHPPDLSDGRNGCGYHDADGPCLCPRGHPPPRYGVANE